MKKLTRILALVLALVMAMSAAALANAADDIMTPYGPYPETITLTTVRKTDPNPKWPEGDSIDNNVMTRYIEEKLNVKIVTAWETDSSSYIEKLTLDIVGDTLPDMWTLDNDDYLVYKMLYENGMLADLTEAYDKCANWYQKETSESFNNVHFTPYTEDGKLMGIPSGKYGYEHNLLWIRTDILQKTGMTADEIKSIEDIETFLTKVTEVDENIVPLALNATDPLATYGVSYSADPIAAAFGAIPRYWIEQEDGSVTYGSIMPGMKDALAVLADWYQKGLIDKEFATRSGQTDALLQGGQVAACWAPWWFGWGADAVVTNGHVTDVDAQSAWTIINAPLDAEGNYNAPWPAVAGTTLFVNAKCETPEAVIKVINVEYDMFRGWDAEARQRYDDAEIGVNWNYLMPTGALNMEYGDVVPRLGHGIVSFIESKGEDKSGLKTPSEVDEAEHLMAGEWLGSYFCRCVASPITDAENVKFVYPAFSQVTESMADLLPSLQTLEKTFVLQVIMGQKSVDDFDAFVNQWLAEGGQTLIDEVNALVK